MRESGRRGGPREVPRTTRKLRRPTRIRATAAPIRCESAVGRACSPCSNCVRNSWRHGPVVDAYTSCSQFVAGNLSGRTSSIRASASTTARSAADAQLPYYEIHYCALPCAPAMYVLAARGSPPLLARRLDRRRVHRASLERLSDQLRLSPNVAGVTLRARRQRPSSSRCSRRSRRGTAASPSARSSAAACSSPRSSSAPSVIAPFSPTAGRLCATRSSAARRRRPRLGVPRRQDHDGRGVGDGLRRLRSPRRLRPRGLPKPPQAARDGTEGRRRRRRRRTAQPPPAAAATLPPPRLAH